MVTLNAILVSFVLVFGLAGLASALSWWIWYTVEKEYSTFVALLPVLVFLWGVVALALSS